MNIAFCDGMLLQNEDWEKPHGFNRGMKGRALELIWNK